MSYQSKRQKISDFFDSKIYPLLKSNDLDYKEILKVIQENTYATESMIEEVIRNKVMMKKIKEIHILTIPDEEIPNFLERLKIIEKEKEKTKEDLDKIFGKEDGKNSINNIE